MKKTILTIFVTFKIVKNNNNSYACCLRTMLEKYIFFRICGVVRFPLPDSFYTSFPYIEGYYQSLKNNFFFNVFRTFSKISFVNIQKNNFCTK